jgi:hypothetical protein
MIPHYFKRRILVSSLAGTLPGGAHEDLKQEREKAAKLEDSLAEAQAKAKVGLYKLNPVDPQLESVWFQPFDL